MKKKLLLLFFLNCSFSFGQQFQWVKGFTGNASVEVLGQFIDQNGNIYTTGYYLGSIDFDPGAAEFILTSTGAGNFDAFVSKLDAAGNFIYALSLGGNQNDIGISIAANENGEVYVAGTFRSTADFDPSPGSQLRTSNGGLDFFVLKLSAEGNFMWVHTFGGSADDEALAVSLSADDGLVISGIFRNLVDFDPGAGVQNLNGGAFGDAFLLKLSPDGDFVWAKRYGGNGRDQINSIAIADNDMIYATGTFESTANFNPDGPAFNLSSNGSSDCFLLNVNNDGSFANAIGFGGNAADRATRVATASNGRISICGSFRNSVNFNPSSEAQIRTSNGETDIFIIQYDEFLQQEWIYTAGGTSVENALGIAMHANGKVIATGEFSGDAEFDSNLGPVILNAAGNNDIFLIILDQDGSMIDAQAQGGASVDYGRLISVKDDYFIQSGVFSETVNFNTSGTSELTSNQGTGVFISRYELCNPELVSANLSACGSYLLPNGVTVSQSGLYKFTDTDENGCLRNNLYDLTIINVDTNVDLSAETLEALADEATFQWLSCDNNYAIIPGATDADFTPPQTGFYAVEVTQQSCVDTSACFQVVISNVNALASRHWTIYPNPVSDFLHVKLLSGKDNDFQFHCFDASGRSIILPFEKENGNLVLHTRHLESGTYFIRLSDSNHMSVKRFVR